MACNKSALDCAAEIYLSAAQETRILVGGNSDNALRSIEAFLTKADDIHNTYYSPLLSKLENFDGMSTEAYDLLMAKFKLAGNHPSANPFKELDHLVSRIDLPTAVEREAKLREVLSSVSTSDFSLIKNYKLGLGESTHYSVATTIRNFIHGIEDVPTRAAGSAPAPTVPAGLQAP